MSVKVIRGDCFEVDLPQTGLIVTDPPYGGVVAEKWDVECYRRLGKLIEKLLIPGGTAYVWGGTGTPKIGHFISGLQV